MAIYPIFYENSEFGSGNCNPELLRQEILTAFSGVYNLVSIVEKTPVDGWDVIITEYEQPALGMAIALVDSVVAAHDHTLKTTYQNIETQRVIAQESARNNLYNYRDQTPVAMYAIIIAQRLRTLQGDSDEIESQAQAVAYFTSKMIEHATLIDTGYTTEAGTLMRHAFQAMFLTFVEASEWTSDGSND